jgi:maleate isomerase
MSQQSRSLDLYDARYRDTINPVASLGFIGLATDRASHLDFMHFLRPFDGVAVHNTRIPFAPVATPETLRALEHRIADGVELLVPGQPLATISFSCTAASIAIGLDGVHAAIRSVRPDSLSVTPIDAATEAFRLLGVRRLSVLMPYRIETCGLVLDHIEGQGFVIDKSGTFNLGGDPDMNLMDPERIYEAALEACAKTSDALFISCTGWMTHTVVDRLEKALGKPVLTSNQVLAWRAVRGAGVSQQVSGLGLLFQHK